MKTIILALLAAAAVTGCLPRAHAADASACYSISDADTRAYCVARPRSDRSACYTIQRADLRAQCQAEVR